MHQPSARVVRLERNHNKTIHWEQNDVSARGVVQCQIELVRGVFLGGLLKDCKIMSVQMDLEHVSAHFQGTQRLMSTETHRMCANCSSTKPVTSKNEIDLKHDPF